MSRKLNGESERERNEARQQVWPGGEYEMSYFHSYQACANMAAKYQAAIISSVVSHCWLRALKAITLILVGLIHRAERLREI